MMPVQRLTVTVLALLILSGSACISVAVEGNAGIVLTNAADVLALSDARATSGIPVSIKGIVTATQTNWNGRFFVQDASGGVFIENKTRQPSIGDVLEITGVTRAGGYAPCITKPIWKKTGTAPLPDPWPVTIEELMSGTEDGQRIEISGVLRSAQPSGDLLGIELVSGGYRFHAYLPYQKELNLESLVGAKVLVKGTAATAYNAPLRHIVTVTLYIPQASDFIIEQPAPANPYDEPLTPLNAIAQYRKNRLPGSQMHVKGVVTYQRKGEDLFLQDASGGLQVKSKLTDSVIPGEVVEAVGFPAVENFLPVLEDAVFRKTGEPLTDLVPTNVMIADLQKGLHHADYVNLKGVLVDRLARGIGRTADEPVIQTTLVLQNSNVLFEA